MTQENTKKESFWVQTKDVSYEFYGFTAQEAIKDFFKRLKDGKIRLDQVGMIGEVWVHAGLTDGDIIPFRIFPNLYTLGYIDFETMAQRTEEIVESAFTKSQLLELVKNDKWMLDSS